MRGGRFYLCAAVGTDIKGAFVGGPNEASPMGVRVQPTNIYVTEDTRGREYTKRPG